MSIFSVLRKILKTMPTKYNDDDEDVRTSRLHALREIAREPARWKLPKVRDYCSSGRRDARGRSVSKSVFAPSLRFLLPARVRKRERASRECERKEDDDNDDDGPD